MKEHVAGMRFWEFLRGYGKMLDDRGLGCGHVVSGPSLDQRPQAQLAETLDVLAVLDLELL